MKYGIYTRHTAKPGQRDNLVDNLLRAGDLLQANPACIHWIVNTTEDPDVVWISSLFSSKEEHDASLKPDDMRALMGEAKELLSEEIMPEQIFMTPVGGKGL